MTSTTSVTAKRRGNCGSRVSRPTCRQRLQGHTGRGAGWRGDRARHQKAGPVVHDRQRLPRQDEGDRKPSFVQESLRWWKCRAGCAGHRGKSEEVRRAREADPRTNYLGVWARDLPRNDAAEKGHQGAARSHDLQAAEAAAKDGDAAKKDDKAKEGGDKKPEEKKPAEKK